MADLYDLLGVAPDADAGELKRAFRRRARELHPDAGGDEETFKELNRAYGVLSDPARRARYDRFGDDGTPGSRGAGADPFGFGAGGGLGDVLDAFFGSAFGGQPTGGGRGARRDQPGRDVLVPTVLTLEEVATGVRRPVEVEVAATCSTCEGTGSASGGGTVTCSTCAGVGQVQRVHRTAFGQLASAATCPDCEGSGRAVEDPCPDCDGDGRRVERRTVTVEVTPGIEHGDRLRVNGAGEAGRHGAAAGDLYVEVRVEPHDRFHREGRDLVAEVDVPFTQAALGARLAVPAIGGEQVAAEVRPGTQHGDVVTIRRAGLPGRGGNGRGDLHLRMHVAVPTDLDDTQEQLLRELAMARGEDVDGRGEGMLARLRRALR